MSIKDDSPSVVDLLSQELDRLELRIESAERRIVESEMRIQRASERISAAPQESRVKVPRDGDVLAACTQASMSRRQVIKAAALATAGLASTNLLRPQDVLAQASYPDGIAITGGSLQLAGYPFVGAASVPIAILTNQAPWRIFVASAVDPVGSTDNVLALVYNCSYSNSGGGWGIPDLATEPTMQMSFESRWNGNAAWNWDLSAPGAGSPGTRPWGAEFTYATKHVAISMGGTNLGPGMGGLRVTGGPQGALSLMSAAGQGAIAPILTLQRGNGSTFMKLHPSGFNMVATSDPSADINPAGYDGFMSLLSTSQAFTVGATSPSDITLQSGIKVAGGATDVYRRFILHTDGTMEWGPGIRPTDTRLYRNAPNSLKTDGVVAVSQLVSNASGSRISQGSGAPSSPNQVAPNLGDVYFRTDTPTVPNQRIYICIQGGASPTWTGIA